MAKVKKKKTFIIHYINITCWNCRVNHSFHFHSLLFSYKHQVWFYFPIYIICLFVIQKVVGFSLGRQYAFSWGCCLQLIHKKVSFFLHSQTLAFQWIIMRNSSPNFFSLSHLYTIFYFVQAYIPVQTEPVLRSGSITYYICLYVCYVMYDYMGLVLSVSSIIIIIINPFIHSSSSLLVCFFFFSSYCDEYSIYIGKLLLRHQCLFFL